MNTAPKLSSKKEQGWTEGMRRIEPEEALNQQNKDSQGLIKETEKEENNKESLRMPSPEEMRKKKQNLKVTGKYGWTKKRQRL